MHTTYTPSLDGGGSATIMAPHPAPPVDTSWWAELATARIGVFRALVLGEMLSNPLIAACGARHAAGFFEPGGFAPEPALFAPWPQQGHEVDRLMALIDHLGIPRCSSGLEFPISDTDRIELASVWPGAYAGA